MTTKNSSLTEALLETAQDMHRVGIMDDAAYQKITIRHLGATDARVTEPMTADEIKQMREREHLSQAVLARYLNVTTGYISKLERGAKQPTGPALAMLNIINRKGIEAII